MLYKEVTECGPAPCEDTACTRIVSSAHKDILLLPSVFCWAYMHGICLEYTLSNVFWSSRLENIIAEWIRKTEAFDWYSSYAPSKLQNGKHQQTGKNLRGNASPSGEMKVQSCKSEPMILCADQIIINRWNASGCHSKKSWVMLFQIGFHCDIFWCNVGSVNCEKVPSIDTGPHKWWFLVPLSSVLLEIGSHWRLINRCLIKGLLISPSSSTCHWCSNSMKSDKQAK